MNFKRLLLFLAAPLALVMSSCEPDGPVYTTPSISITDADGAEVTAVNFSAEGGDATITITATRGWSISKQATWLGVTPSTYTNDTMEEKSVDVKITVGPNEDGPRTETIKVVMDKVEKNVVVSQAGEGQTALGDVLYYDNFDKVVAAEIEGKGWPYMSAEYGNPTPENQSGVTYASHNVTIRANSFSDGEHSNYEGSGKNNVFFGKTPNYLTISGISLAELEGNALTMTFGTEKYNKTSGSVFTESEFHVYISADSKKWTEIDYTFGGQAEGKWDVATAQFNLKEVPESISLAFVVDFASSYRLDDLKLTAGGGGAEIDLSQGIELEIESGSGSGSTGGDNTPIEKDPNAQTITVAEFIEKAETETTYQLTGTISGSINTQYGNFDLVDESGSIYIYGLKEESGANVDWTAKGLNAGDVITVQGKYTLYTGKDGNTKHEIVNALYISHVDGEEPEVPEVELPEGTIVWEFGKDKQEWADDTHATYGAGTAATVDNVKFGFYKNTNTNDWNTTLQNDHVRVFKGAALAVKATDGKLIKSVVFECTYADKCANLSVSDGSTAVADTEALTISWTTEEGVAEFAAVAAAGQVRLKKMYLVLEGEGGGNTEPEDPEDPEDPEQPEQPTTVTLDEITAEGTYNITGATVVAVEYSNMVVKGTEKMFNVKKLANASANYNVGDVLSLTNATVKDAFGVTVIDGEAKDLVIEKTGTATVEHGEATAIDAAWVTSFTESLVPEYVTVSGVGAASGSPFSLNIAVEGSDINMSVTLPTKDEVTALVGKNVTATGYAFDYNSKNKYVSIMKVDLTVVEGGETPEDPEDPEDPEIPVEPETLEALDANAYYVFKQATEFAPGKWYAMVAENNAATALTSDFGYLKVVTPIALTEGISLPASCAWGIVSTEGGYTIQQYDGKYVYQTGSYDSFNVDATAPASGHVWTIENGVITNAETSKTVQFDTQYNSYGCYDSVKGVYPAFYELVEVDTNAHLLGTSVSSLSYTADGGEKTFDVATYGEATLAATTAAEWLTVSVADGVVTVAAAANEGEAREAEVTVTFGDSSETVAVEQAAPLAEGEAAWVLVTDAATLAVGDQIVIVATGYDKALSTTQNNNNRKATSVTKSGNTVTFDSTVQVITLEAGTVDNTFGFNVGTGYLYAASGSSNHLKTGTLNDNASWLVTIDGSGVATIKAQGDKARNWMRYNSQNDLFSCYASGQADIAIYKYTE